VLNKRLYTFIVSSHADARLWRLSLPYPLLIGVAVFAVIGLISAGVATYHYGRMLLKVADYDHLLAENDSFRSENHNYRIQTAQLGEKIDFLETLAKKLTVYSGMESERSVGGVGGYSKDAFAQPLPSSAGTLKAIDSYNKSVSGLEDGYRKIGDRLSLQALVKSVTPDRLPVRGYITEGFGMRRDPFTGAGGEYHSGVDISAPLGSRVIAPADGMVIFAGYRAGYGKIVVIDHMFGMITRYGHLQKFNVQAGQRVSRNDVIGYVGNTGRSTGPHLHFELWWHNKAMNPARFVTGSRRG
jgi:murein DD-endopeptidase MepM/ murein hydrolase activator NlpD